MNAIATPIRPVIAAPVLADAQAEVQRIETALAEVDAELLGLDLAGHLDTLGAALDTAIDAGDADAISKAAQALQAAKTECDAQGTARMVAMGRQRSLRAALVHARVALAAAQKDELRDQETRLRQALDVAWSELEAMLEPMIAAHLRVAYLANAVWKTRATIVGVPQVNITTPQSYFALPCPNGPMPNFGVRERPDQKLTRTVDLAAPIAVVFGVEARPWKADDRELVDRIRAEVEEVARG